MQPHLSGGGGGVRSIRIAIYNIEVSQVNICQVFFRSDSIFSSADRIYVNVDFSFNILKLGLQMPNFRKENRKCFKGETIRCIKITLST